MKLAKKKKKKKNECYGHCAIRYFYMQFYIVAKLLLEALSLSDQGHRRKIPLESFCTRWHVAGVNLSIATVLEGMLMAALFYVIKTFEYR